MIQHYLKILFRILWQNKIQNTINILGLSVGIISVVVITKYVDYSLAADNFQQNQKEVFQLGQAELKNGKIIHNESLTYRGIAISCQSDLPEIINYTRFDQSVESLMVVSGKKGAVISGNENSIFFVDSSFLEIFTYKELLGNQKNALSNPYSAVITKSIAKKYFSNNNPIGQTFTTIVSWGLEQTWTITCVLEDPPKNSRLKFDVLVSGPTDNNNLWDSPVHYQFIQTNKVPKGDNLTKKISNHISNLPIFRDQERLISITLTPLTPTLTFFEVMLALVGLIILILSWINFINLSIAQSINRFDEIVIRKAFGSTNKQLIKQFFLESMLTNGIALFVTLMFLIAFYDHFMEFTDYHLLPLLSNNFHTYALFIILFVMGSIITSAGPSFFVVSCKISKVKNKKGQGLRKALVIAQFAISSILVISIFVISAQLTYMKNRELGFRSENQLIIKPPKDKGPSGREKLKYLKNEFGKLTWITSITSSTTIPGQSYRNEVNFTLKGSNESVLLYVNGVNTNFANTYEIKFVAGDDFSKTGGNADKVIINEISATALGLSPSAAIGEVLFDQESKEEYTIIGVIENYHKTSLKDNIGPMILKFNPRRGYITLNLTSNSTYLSKNEITQLKKVWLTAYSDQPFEYFFLFDKYYEQYKTEDRFYGVFKIFTFISIFLACFGLIGLSLLEAANSKLEVGIRKAVGASSSNILVLFFKKYLLLLLIATSIGAPIAYFLMEKWLTEYSFRILIGPQLVLVPTLILLTTAISSIALQIVKLSLVNPINVLRDD